MKHVMTICAAGLLLLTVGCAGRNQQCPCPQVMMPPPPPCCCNQQGREMHTGMMPSDGPGQPEMNDQGQYGRSHAKGKPQRMRGPGMSPEATEACQDKKDGDSCTFSDKGWTLTGVCATQDRMKGPKGDPKKDKPKKTAPLTCSPENPPKNQVDRPKAKHK